MANPTNYYVDPGIAGNSGAGTVGDPYGDIQHALDTVTRDSTNGDQFNIKAGTDEILAAALSLATYGTPAAGAPLVFRGYTSAADDGGIGGISGNGTYGMLATVPNATYFIDMHLHNSGSATVLQLGTDGAVQNCEIDNSTGSGLVVSSYTSVTFCYIHNIGTTGLQPAAGLFAFNHFENGTNDFTNAINVVGNVGGMIFSNVFDLDGSSNGINCNQRTWKIYNNSIYCNAGTGTGINLTTGRNQECVNNIIEGFSGVGGDGIVITSPEVQLYGHNVVYNCTTAYNVTGEILNDLGNNETLTSSPFADAANDDFRVLSAVKATAWPTANWDGLDIRTYFDKGAFQREEANQPLFRGVNTLLRR